MGFKKALAAFLCHAMIPRTQDNLRQMTSVLIKQCAAVPSALPGQAVYPRAGCQQRAIVLKFHL